MPVHPVSVRSPQVRFRRSELSISTEQNAAGRSALDPTGRISIDMTTKAARNPEHLIAQGVISASICPAFSLDVSGAAV